jgi:hypothetical protein
MSTPGFTPVQDSAGATPGFTPIEDRSAPQTTSTGIAAPQGTEGEFGDAALRFGKGVWQGAKGAVQGAGALGKDLLSNPNWVISEPGKPSTMQKFVFDPADQTMAKAKQAYGQGHYSEAAGYGAAAALPLAGPWAASLGEQAGSGDIAGAAGQAIGGIAAGKIGAKLTTEAMRLPQTAADFMRRANSMEEVNKASTGTYKQIQNQLDTLRGVIQNEGHKTMQQAIEADKAAQVGPQGAIVPIKAITETAKAIEETGYMPTAAEQKVLSAVTNAGSLTLDDAVKMRSLVGNAAAKAERAGNAKGAKVLWTNYQELGNSIGDRVEELQGSRKPFDHYNNEFKAYYELHKGIAGSMMDSVADRGDTVAKLKEFGDADLSEIEDQMKKYGLDTDKLKQIQENAQSVTSAHDSISGKYNKSLYRMILGGGAGIAVPLSVYAVARGAGMYGLAPMLLASYMGAQAKGIPSQMETGRILRTLSVDPEAFNVRTPVEGPMKFDYPNQDQVYSEPTKASKVSQIKKARGK